MNLIMIDNIKNYNSLQVTTIYNSLFQIYILVTIDILFLVFDYSSTIKLGVNDSSKSPSSQPWCHPIQHLLCLFLLHILYLPIKLYNLVFYKHGVLNLNSPITIWIKSHPSQSTYNNLSPLQFSWEVKGCIAQTQCRWDNFVFTYCTSLCELH